MKRDLNGNPYKDLYVNKKAFLESLAKKTQNLSEKVKQEADQGLSRLSQVIQLEKNTEAVSRKQPASRKPVNIADNRDTERIDLLRFFLQHPDQAKLCGQTNLQNKEKQLLLESARDCYRHNWTLLKQREDKREWIEMLERDMNRETGLLGILNRMMDESQRKDTVSWNTLRERALRKLTELEEPRTQPLCPEEAIPQTVEKLVQALEKQLLQLQETQLPSDFALLLPHLRQILLPEKLGEGNFWCRRTAVILERAMREIPEELQQALQEDYPHLFSKRQSEET